MSASGPQSSHSTNASSQTTVQGAAGAASPTLTAGGNLSSSQVNTTNDPTLQLKTVQALQDVVNNALAAAGQVTTKIVSLQTDANSATAGQADAQNQLLSQVIQNEQALAAAQGTGGASLTYNTNNYLIFGAIGIALLAVFGLFFRRKAA